VHLEPKREKGNQHRAGICRFKSDNDPQDDLQSADAIDIKTIQYLGRSEEEKTVQGKKGKEGTGKYYRTRFRERKGFFPSRRDSNFKWEKLTGSKFKGGEGLAKIGWGEKKGKRQISSYGSKKGSENMKKSIKGGENQLQH